MRGMMGYWTRITALIGFAICSSSVGAIEITDNFEIHGYGHVGYLETSANQYLKADSSGTFNYNAAAALFALTLNDKTKLWAQAFTASTNTKKARWDWVFLDYRPVDNLALHIGQIKMPMGLNNDVRDIAYLQLSTLPPSLYQESADFVEEAIQGVAVVYDHSVGNGSFSWDIYGGKSVSFDPAEPVHTNMAGLRLTYNTPIEGLRFMVSNHRAHIENIAGSATSIERSYLLSAEYVADALNLKAEYGKRKVFGNTSETGYIQAGYTFSEKWTPFIRKDFITTDIDQRDNPAFYQKTTSIGLSYKINKNLAIRIEDHFNNGYALPIKSEEIEADSASQHWNLFSTSLVFMF